MEESTSGAGCLMGLLKAAALFTALLIFAFGFVIGMLVMAASYLLV